MRAGERLSLCVFVFGSLYLLVCVCALRRRELHVYGADNGSFIVPGPGLCERIQSAGTLSLSVCQTRLDHRSSIRRSGVDNSSGRGLFGSGLPGLMAH